MPQRKRIKPKRQQRQDQARAAPEVNSQHWVQPSSSVPRRFPVGSRVVCNVRSRDGLGIQHWAPGTVIKHDHREPSWGPDREAAPYQVQLDAWDPCKEKYTARRGTGVLIFAPHDDDTSIQLAPPTDKAPPGGICWTNGRDGGGSSSSYFNKKLNQVPADPLALYRGRVQLVQDLWLLLKTC